MPDFAGSDAPLTADDINTFTSGPREAARTNLVQVPALGAFIGLPLQLAGGYAGTPNLTTDQVCGIFAGVYRSWDQVGLSSSADPIDVVYRSDDSGTVFAFTQYLASTCNGRTLGNFTIPSNFFQTNELFEDAVPVAPAVLYAEASPASGNGGIITEVEADAWSIGFANYSNIDAENQGGNTLGYAKIDNNHPASGGSISVGTGDILIDTVLGNPGASGLPTTLSLASAGGTEEECLAVVDPAIQLTQTYPIVAFTNLLTYTDDNAEPAAVEDLFEEVTAGSSSLPAGYARINSTDVGNIISSCIDIDRS
ncbi:putative alkaline phosphatase [Alcanivorax sp. 521-1]|uniref:Alkaline phosphatase n=1 Tax=Alloalcanivorax profundimaris TaxID=2735259 RepID=A0ABS0APF0_9GAMM|nr:putative alkaline phosphatase [Alloalcanivorax profundimaris]